MPDFINILLVVFFSSFKFAMIFPIAIATMNFSFFEVILWTNVGGVIGIYFFGFLSEHALRLWRKLFPVVERKRVRPLFTSRNRRIARIKSRYGLPGIAFTTPLILSIPVGTFLAVRYYPKNYRKFPYLIISNLFWSLIYTLFYSSTLSLLFN